MSGKSVFRYEAEWSPPLLTAVSEARSQLRRASIAFDSLSDDLTTSLWFSCVSALDAMSQLRVQLHNSLGWWVLLHICFRFHLSTAAVKQMLVSSYIRKHRIPSRWWNFTVRWLVNFHHKNKKEEDWMYVTHRRRRVWRWGGRWWCPSTAPSSSPQTSGGRLGTPAGPSAWTELRPRRPPRRGLRRTGWEAQRPESGSPTSEKSATCDPISDDLQMTLMRNKMFNL